MSHSHLALEHLLKKLETRQPRQKRGPRPEWMSELVTLVAEAFEPFVDVGRVGYECRLDEQRWELRMYLGATECVGGKADGEIRQVDFQFDVMRLQQIFAPVESLVWNAFPSACPTAAQQSCLVLQGGFREQPVRLRVLCTPPDEAGPGLRQHTDGSWEPV